MLSSRISLRLGKFAIHRAVFVGNESEVPIDSSTIRTGQSFLAVNPETGATLANFDEVKLKVTAVGEDGFDYKSSTITFIAEEEPGAEVPGEGSGEDNEQSGDGDESSSGSRWSERFVIGGVVFLVMLMVIASTRCHAPARWQEISSLLLIGELRLPSWLLQRSTCRCCTCGLCTCSRTRCSSSSSSNPSQITHTSHLVASMSQGTQVRPFTSLLMEPLGPAQADSSFTFEHRE